MTVTVDRTECTVTGVYAPFAPEVLEVDEVGRSSCTPRPPAAALHAGPRRAGPLGGGRSPS